MNTKTRRLKREKELKAKCSCKADVATRTIFVCDNCVPLLHIDKKIIHVPEANRIGNR